MLDQLPEEVWSNPNLQWLDPANGIGNFPVVAYYRLMEGLQPVIPEKQQRSTHIIENMLFMVELNPINCKVCKRIFNMIDKTAEPNIIQADFLEWKAPNKFDIIIGNPPYQKQVGKTKTQSIWENFFDKSILLLKIDMYLLLIHPSSWRSPSGSRKHILDKILELDLQYLYMCSYECSSKYFKGVSTNFDYYCLKNTVDRNNITTINDTDNIQHKINLNNLTFIPNGKFNEFLELMTKPTEKTVNIIFERSMYGNDKKNMSKTRNKEFKFPCVYSITLKNGILFMYSNENKGMFGTPKVIWSNGAGTYPILDLKGEYGLTNFANGIIDEPKKLPLIKKALESEKFIDLMKYGVFGQNHKYNWQVIKTFKKDFWKEFI